jgi:CheY-like chemotaxis protein
LRQNAEYQTLNTKYWISVQVYILVEIEEVTQSHETFRFKVFDSGIGITEDGQKKLFSRFSQVDSSTTRIYGGTGLGLAISKQFSELMDGSMGVQSNVGKGSLFWFSAVFKRSLSLAKHTAFDPISTQGISLEVIVVADNATLRNSLLRYIEQLKISVVAVKDMPAAQDMMSKGNGEAFRIIVACPVVRVDEGMVSNGGGSRRDESLLGMVECLREIMEKDSKVHTMLLCPITQLSQAASYRSSDKWTVVSRPISLSVLYNSIQDIIVRVRAVTGSQLSLPMPQVLTSETANLEP